MLRLLLQWMNQNESRALKQVSALAPILEYPLWQAKDHIYMSKMRGEGCRMRTNVIKEINSCFYTSVLLVFKIVGFSD